MPHFAGVISAGGFSGNLTGNVQGSVTGDVAGGIKEPTEIKSANGAIALKAGIVLITKSTVCALTIPNPAAADDGKRLHIVSTTPQAHTVTYSTAGFNGGGTNTDVATFGETAGNSMSIVAYNQKWWTIQVNGVTLG